jgi:hypothetical protein
MCDSCINILGSNVKKHLIHQCPLKKGSYCCFCSSFGHSPRTCSKDLTFREAQTLEQLIPISILEEYGIKTNTKISQTTKPNLPKPKIVLDYIDESKAIRSLLKAYGNMPKNSDRSKDKYKNHLIKFAKQNSLELVKHDLEKSESNVDGDEQSENNFSESSEYSDESNKSFAKGKQKSKYK